MRGQLGAIGITRVANLTGLDTIGIPTVQAIRPNARSLSVAQGKGCDLESAKASAVMESIEQYLAERPAVPLRWASYSELSGKSTVVDVSRLPAYIRRKPFDIGQSLFWTEARDLSTGHAVYVPIDMVHLNLSWPLHTVSGYFPVGSNGLASGNSLVEAIAHALWELIERDALARFYQMSAEAQAARRIALDSITDTDARDLLARYARADVAVGIWDMTSDIRIPAFFCAVVDNVQHGIRPLGRALGFGCHSSSGVALCRALTEAAQSRLTRISGARDDMRTAQRSTQAHELGADVGWRQFSEVASHAFPTLAMDVLWTVEMLRGAGLTQQLFVDLSVPELPVSVVRVIVPGLEGAPDTPGYVAGARCQHVA